MVRYEKDDCPGCGRFVDFCLCDDINKIPLPISEPSSGDDGSASVVNFPPNCS